jgi:uroporphyrin-III C-methyltransferase
MPVYVVGAGPGDPRLLTLRAVELLQQANIVAFGELVPDEIVRLYAPRARVVKLGHRRAEHDAVIDALIEEAGRGLNVVVLKNGDPAVFGRGVQICARAESRGVPCEIVPGVPAFAAAAALFKIELTNGKTLRHVSLYSFPHFSAETLRSAATDTVVVHMMGNRLDVVRRAVEQGCSSEAEVFVCYAVSLGGECRRVAPSELLNYKNKRPLLVIVRGCRSGSGANVSPSWR